MERVVHGPIEPIPTESLTLDLIPTRDAPLEQIARFAFTFNGYAYWGKECGTVANERRHATLVDLRTCLFFEQRRWRHYGREPDEEAQMYWRDLVEMIRERFAAGERS